MATQEGFPRKLLDRTVTEKVAYFKQYTMAHPKLSDAAQRLMCLIQEPAGTGLIFLLGPTGVGKSTLLQRLSQKIIEAALPDLEQDSGRIPIAGIEAATPEFSNFDWRDFYFRGLKALSEPCIQIPSRSRINTLKLRQTFESALQHRQPAAFYIDEAQNLGKVASGRKLRDQTDCLKSLANLTGVLFVLTGTYELLMLRNLSAQLCRRAAEVHFSRYQSDTVDDLKQFRAILQTFQRHLPLMEEPDLLRDWEFCYERCIGCVGILKDWLTRAFVTALNQGQHTLTRSDLEATAWSAEQCFIMLSEAKEGESKLDNSNPGAMLRIALGLETMPPPVSQVQQSAPSKNRRVRPGTSLPQRLPIGE